jgi:hypothetical protein
MKLFSERYGYIDLNDVIIREQITEPVLNSILNWWDIINSRYTIFESQIYNREKIERHI